MGKKEGLVMGKQKIIIILTAMLLMGCASTGVLQKEDQLGIGRGIKKEGISGPEINDSRIRAGKAQDNTVKGSELMCSCDSEEEAKKTAQIYGIELVDFSYGIATFHTEEDPYELVRKGAAEGWPELSVNTLGKAY